MKTHCTNYYNTFIEIADDCSAKIGEIPPIKGEKKTAANIQFDLVFNKPYTYTSDYVLFQVYADKNMIKKSDYLKARAEFFSKGQPCFRASPLTKRYGWGVHSNQEGKIALFACETKDYILFVNNKNLKILKALKTKK